MSREIPTIKGATYVVTPTADGTVTALDGTVIASFVVGAQTTFVAPVKRVIVSDEQASVDVYFNPAAPAGSGGGRMNNRALEKHLADTSLHLSASERAHLESSVPDFSVPEPPVPEGALSPAVIRRHFALNAQPGSEGVPAASSAPPAVYISRVPWARYEGDGETGQWVNNASSVDESVFGVARKLMDNAGLRHQCSTDTDEGEDDYNGKLWPFYWQHANYMTDEYGVKHLTDIRGVHESFDPYTNNVAAFGPAFWFFCCQERSRKADGSWTTHDGTENGTPLFQLWGISTRPWEELNEARQAELRALGVTPADFHLWPECQQWDAAAGKLVPRSYWCHSAYFGGAELREDGAYKMVSKRNLPPFTGLSYSEFNGLYDWQPGHGGGACINGFGMLFDIVKNATKDSQAIHKGMSQNNCSAVQAAHPTAGADYLFPIAAAGNFRVGCTVWLTQEAFAAREVPGVRSAETQIGRIVAIETRALPQPDGSTAESLCLVLDPATVEPFVVCTDAAATRELTDAGTHACCYATQSMALSGETDAVLFPHDGSCVSVTDGRHPYRVQGTEFMPGAWMIAADVIAIKGNGRTPIELNGEEKVPTDKEYIFVQAPLRVERLSGPTIAACLSAGYVVLGVSKFISGYVANMQLSGTGVALPVDIGGTGTSSGTGHADNYYSAASVAYLRIGGALNYGVQAGSACMFLNFTCSSRENVNSARD